MSFRLRLAVAAVAAAPALALAQAPSVPASASPSTPAAPAVALDKVAASLAAGSWTWSATMTNAGKTQEMGTRTVKVLKGATAGEWLLVDVQSSAMATATDTLVLAAADLSTTRRAMHAEMPMGSVSMALRFTKDSVLGEMKAPNGGQTIAAANVRNSILSDAVLLVAVAKLPLAAAWTGRVDFLNPMSGTAMPMTLTVTGSEKVSVPAGEFDAWVVKGTGPNSATFYVAKGGPVVKVVASGIPQLPGAVVETVLTK